MNVGQLFVTLGVKGADKAGSALTGMRKQMSSITSTSLEAKAAIIGVAYGLERLMSQSAQMGTNLEQFSNLTGLSSDRLQRWQFLALKSGESADEMASSIQGVQNSMTKMILGQSAPSGITALRNLVGFDREKARDTFYVMDKLREYAQKTKDIPDVSNEILRSFGLSDKTVQALRTSRVNLDNITPGHMYSKSQQEALNRVNIGWATLGDKIQHKMGGLNAKFGPKLITDISKLADTVMRLVDAFGMLANKLELMKVFSSIFDGWGQIFTLITDVLNTADPKKKGKSSWLPTATSLKLFAKDMVGYGAPPTIAPQTNVTTNVTVHGIANGEELANHISKHVKGHIDQQHNKTMRQIQTGGH